MMLGFVRVKVSKQYFFSFLLVNLFCLMMAQNSNGQQSETDSFRNTEFYNSQLLWNGIYTKYRIGEKLWYNGEYHVRTRNNFVNEMAQLYIRIGLSYLVTKNFEITGGIVTPFYWVNEKDYPENTPLDKVVPQFRFWQQYLFIQSVGRSKVYHQIRTEQRWRRDFIVDSPFELTHRFRYKIMAYIPINKPELQTKTWFVSLYNEVFIQAGKSIQLNYLEDNRTFVGIGYILNENIQLQTGYMKSFQQRANGFDFNNRDILRISVYHNFDFYYKKKISQGESLLPNFY
ncbi:DUF2490 domain-containing protein [Aquiflexum lacus]|uniref:DUF2490 domain-containing protein n=1 Tax=Aquiflexum lacus TaxID=2483805 RepID=UPI00189616DC|nr:DUF2490 domain-containing protein [Aquiflexum lacus]